MHHISFNLLKQFIYFIFISHVSFNYEASVVNLSIKTYTKYI